MRRTKPIRVVDKRKRPSRDYDRLLEGFLTSWNAYHVYPPRTIVLTDAQNGGVDVSEPDSEENLLFNTSAQVLNWIPYQPEETGEEIEHASPE